MRRFSGYFLLLALVALAWLLDNPVSSIGLPPLGRLVDPFNGSWVAAEPVKKDFNAQLQLQGVDTNARVWFDRRLVAHV